MYIWSAVVAAVLAFSPALAQESVFEWNKKSTFTAEYPVEFPGIVLEPGTYIVRLREAGERCSRIEILNRNESQVLATVRAVPDHRVRPDDNSDFTFHEAKGDGARPVQTWYFSGDLIGLEFVYPTGRAKEIAKESQARVMASEDLKDGPIVAVTPNGKQVMIDDDRPLQTARQKPQ